MIKNFDDAFAKLVDPMHEGGYSNNPADPGGETMYGVTKKVAMQNGYSGDMKLLPLATAKAIAKKCYWDVCSLDQIDPNIAFQVFDAVYNHGIAAPSMWLQKSVGATPDGKIGPATIAAVNATPWYLAIMAFLSYRTTYYTTLGQWPTFGRGWTNRIAANLSIAGSIK